MRGILQTMINTEDILQFHMAEVVIEHLNLILFDNHDKPDAGKILGTMIHQCHKMQREVLAGQHPYWIKEYTENNPSVWTPVKYRSSEEAEASLERWAEFYDRADYLFIKAVVADDKAHAQELIAEALKLRPDCSCMQLVAITCRPYNDHIPILLAEIKEFYTSQAYESERRFIELVRFLELVECRPGDCKPEELIPRLRALDIHPLLHWSLCNRLVRELRPNILREVFRESDIFGENLYGFRELILGAVNFKLGNHETAVRLLEAADIGSIKCEYMAKFLYYCALAESYRLTGNEGKSILLKKELLEEYGSYCANHYFEKWVSTVLDMADYHTRQGEKGRAGELMSWIELYMVPSIPGHCLPLYYKLLGDLSLGRSSRYTAFRFYSVSYNLRPTEDVRERMEGLEGEVGIN